MYRANHASSNSARDDSFKCCSKDYKTIAAKAKQLKAKNICIHVHILICLGVISSDKIVVSSSPALASVQPLFPQASPASTSSGAELFSTNAVGSEIPSTIPNSAASDEPVDTISRTSTVQLKGEVSRKFAVISKPKNV